MRFLAGLDLGTTGCRCILFSHNFEVYGEEYLEYPLITQGNSIVEQDANLWWELSIAAIRGAAKKAKCSLFEIDAMSISSQGITIVPVNDRFLPLSNAISWLDQRSFAEADDLLNNVGQSRYEEITARNSPRAYGISKIMWLMRHKPDVVSKAAFFLMPMDYLIARLCNVALTDHSMAAGTGCYDINLRNWSGLILDAASVSAKQLPLIQNSGTIAGYVSHQVAVETGLREGMPIAIGAQDQKCGALAAGIDFPVAAISLGTCMAMLIKTDKPIYNAEINLPCFSDIFQDGYLLEGYAGTGAGSIKWFRDLFCPTMSYGQLTSLANQYCPDDGSPFFFPHLSGIGTPKHCDVGSGGFLGFRLSTGLAGVVHSILESIAFMIRQNLDAGKIVAGAEPVLLRIYGGGAQSREWLQIIADVTKLPVESLYTHEISCVGAAILASLAIHPDIDYKTLQEKVLRVADHINPNKHHFDVYDRRYESYNQYEKRIFGC